ncbi:uncharacterized protein LOC111046830 [Nilaparvata lugens]|uniref:uncharacterized protein LOC111046830 n=1 Tax=Nilaparvata lugens TaxID=108931 RepID=UPI00193EB5AB|nr:uncharacterized protein LOC111046830 [Nilaparvata lugens]
MQQALGMIQYEMFLFVAFLLTITLGQVISSPLFDFGSRYSDLDEIAAKCKRICKANNGEVHIDGAECRCRIRTENPVESVDHILKRAGREGLNLVPKLYPRFRRSPCLGVSLLGSSTPLKNPRLMQQRLRAYGVGMLAPILGISPEQVNVLVSDIMKGNYQEPIVIGQPKLGINLGQPSTTGLVIGQPSTGIVTAQQVPDTAQVADNMPLATDSISLAAINVPVDDMNQNQDVVGSMIEMVPSKKVASDMAIEGEPMLGLQRSIVPVPIVGGKQVPSVPVVSEGVLAVEGPIVSPFKTRRFVNNHPF